MLVHSAIRRFANPSSRLPFRQYAPLLRPSTRGFATPAAETTTTASAPQAGTATDRKQMSNFVEGQDSHAMNGLLYVARVATRHPIAIIFFAIGAYRISTNVNEDDERNHKQGGKAIADLRQSRRDSMKAWKEHYWQREVQPEYQPNYGKNYEKRKGR